MAYVILGTCINDAACVDVCPVACIHPAPAEAGFATADMLYIDPQICIDCNACAEACPINAIVREQDLTPKLLRYKTLNAEMALARSKVA
nr:ferredoxin family protein [Solimonas terrae]